MEDAHCAELKLFDTDACFFGVYDGHGGKLFIIIVENTYIYI
jgi:serine/threonine protein phosphatase PrpC